MRHPRRILTLALPALLAALALASSSAHAEEADVEEVSAAGIELDAAPYLMGGFHASAWSGSSGWRVRPVVARAYPPDFMLKDGFEAARVDALALLVDWFPRWREQGYRGFWVGAGFEYWRSIISRVGYGGFSTYTNGVVTAGGGYVWPVWRSVYLNPWAAGHMVVSGTRRIPVAGTTYEQRVFTPEASVKLGISF